jgi:hypothetical protein
MLVPAILPSLLPHPAPRQAKLMVFLLPAAQINMFDEETCIIERERERWITETVMLTKQLA